MKKMGCLGTALFVIFAGGCATEADMAMEESENVGSSEAAMTYAGSEIFTEVTGQRQSQGGNPKPFSFRARRGNPVTVKITKTGGAGTLTFKTQFSTNNVDWVDSATSDCRNSASIPANTELTFNCADASTTVEDGWVRVTASITQTDPTIDADFTMQFQFKGPCDAAHSCYATDTITVKNLSKTRRFAAVSGGIHPGLYAGQKATVQITRSHTNVDLENGLKYKDRNGVEILPTPVKCGTWNSNVMNCTIGEVTPVLVDGYIRAPVVLQNTNNDPARWAKLVIQRKDANTDATNSNAYVQSGLTAAITVQ